MGSALCLFTPASCGTAIARSGFNDLFDALTTWVASSVAWLLRGAAAVLNSASEPSTVVAGAKIEFTALLVLSPALMMIGLLVATLQALRHGDASALWRVYLGVAPACVAGVALARPLATLVLEAVDQMSSSAATDVAGHVTTLASALGAMAPTTPGFGVFVLAVAVVAGTVLLWCELIVRTVALTLLLVLVPVVVPLSTLPAARRLGWRLAETFVAVAASKLVIVVTLVLGLNELRGSSAAEVMAGAVTLVLATCTPFVLLRVIPFIEQSALHNLEGLRNRAVRAASSAPSSPIGRALEAARPDVPLPGPPTRGEDLGLDTWLGVAETPVPPSDGPPLPPPVGTPRLRGGHVVYGHDDGGPVVGWHFDE
jgi:hypothetical protein